MRTGARDVCWSTVSEPERERRSAYCLGEKDRQVIAAAKDLLWKLARGPLIRPAQLEIVARVLRILERMPRTGEETDLRIELCGPRRQYGEHEIWHWWEIGMEEDEVFVRSGGHFYRESTGGDTFTCMRWSALPACDCEYDDYLPLLTIVDDAQPFEAEVAEIDLTAPGYAVTVYLEGEAVAGEDEGDSTGELEDSVPDDDSEE